MNGAPEGELFTVELLERSQIEAFENEEEAIAALQGVLGDVKSVDQWHLQVWRRWEHSDPDDSDNALTLTPEP